jgi:TPR repeat protein
MQAPAEIGLTEVVNVVDHRVPAFLSKMALWCEESAHNEELLAEMLDRVVELQYEKLPEEGAAYVERLSQLEADMLQIAAPLATLIADPADIGIFASLVFFGKTGRRIRSFIAVLDELAAMIPEMKAKSEIRLGKSDEENLEEYKKIKLEYLESLAQKGTCYSPSSTGFKSASPIRLSSDIHNAVSPMLRPRAFVDEYAATAARMYSTKKYAGAVVQYWTAVYAFDHLPSRYALAWILMYGRRGVPQDYRQAAELAVKGDLRGCIHCTGVLSLCLLQGWGVAMNVARASQLARTSAAAGSRYGQFALGCVFDQHSLRKAVVQYQLSAAQGLDAAQCALGRRFAVGVGVPADKAEALRLFHLAAAEGFPDAFAALADHSGDDEKMQWRMQSFLARGANGEQSLQALEGIFQANKDVEGPKTCSGIKQARQVDEEGVDAGRRKSSKKVAE